MTTIGKTQIEVVEEVVEEVAEEVAEVQAQKPNNSTKTKTTKQ